MRISLTDAWDAALVFARAEIQLWLPIALAFFGLPALAMAILGPAIPHAPDGAHAAATLLAAMPALGALLALLLVALFGSLAIAALVLRPGGSVADAIAQAARRYGVALLTLAVLALALIGYLVVAALLLSVLLIGSGGAVAAGGMPASTPGMSLLTLVLMVPLLVFMIRLATLWPQVADTGRGGWRPIAAAGRATGPIAWRLALVWLLFIVTQGVVQVAVSSAVGAVGLLATGSLGTATAPPGVTAAAAVATAAASSAAQGFWSIFMTCLYRSIGRASSGI